jgi:cysteine synthase
VQRWSTRRLEHAERRPIGELQPSEASGEKTGLHTIRWIGVGFVPKALNVNIVDQALRVEDEYGKDTARRVAREESMLAGISSSGAGA